MILCIETGTDICSVALVADGLVVSIRESLGERDHARLVAVYAEQVLAEAGVTAGDLRAVAVSKGPGSYTGLRIGVSFAKGLCYGLGIPLIGVGSLESLCEVARTKIDHFSSKRLSGNAVEEISRECTQTYMTEEITQTKAASQLFSRKIFIPMIDARRMEVYAQIFDSRGVPQTNPEALIVDENSLAEWREAAEKNGGDVFIFGSGAEKCRQTLPWAHFIDVLPSAKGMARLATEALEACKTEDVAYFEPFYLKDFVITTSNKKLL